MRKIFLLPALLFVLNQTAFTQQRTNYIHGSWKLISGSGNILQRIPENQVPELHFETVNTVTGFTGCNRLTGEYKVEMDQLILGPLMLTKKACDNMEIEMLVQRFLPEVGHYKVEQDKLYLYDKSDRSRFLVFRRMPGTI